VFRRGRYGTADLLVVVQMALAVVLVVVTTMFGRVFHAVLDATPGEHPGRILVGQLAPVPGAGDGAGLVPQVIAALRAVPGMRVALADGPPLISRYPPPLGTDDEGATGRCAGTVRRVTPEYFAALGLRVGSGRLLQEDDEPGVAVASAALARRCWNGTALGHVVTVGGTGRDRRVNVIGVVTDARARADVPGFEALDLYVPYGQPAEGESVTVVIAGQGPMAARGVDLAAVVDRASGRGLSLEGAATLAQLAERELAGPRTLTTVLGVLGGIALVLATAGIYASLSQAFARHRRDYGVRAALGAPPLSLAGLAVGRDSLLVSIGSVAGIVVTLAVTHVVWPEALRIGGADLRMWITLCGVLVASSLVASAGPVWRATHLDPVDALRRADE
jgi:hypothetical protein